MNTHNLKTLEIHQQFDHDFVCLTPAKPVRKSSKDQASSKHPINEQTQRQTSLQTHEKSIIRITRWIQAGFHAHMRPASLDP